MGTSALPDTVRGTFDGELLTPHTNGYDHVRRVHNGLVDRRPALIARCVTTNDVVDAVVHGRDTNLEVTVRGGGHNVAGRAVADDALMIDLSLMRGIHVDVDRQTVRAQGGVTWGQFNRDTGLHRLATTGGMMSTTGIAGLTLGGGLGWLMGKYGLTVDNLRSATVVTAAGEVVTASDEDHPDLFWALRGGGGNFGVVTSFEYRLHPVSNVLAGMVAYPLDAAPEVVGCFRDVSAASPDELTSAVSLVPGSDDAPPLVMMPYCHCGPQRAARADVQVLWQPGQPAASETEWMPYPIVNTLTDDGYPRGAYSYWKAAFVTELSNALARALVDAMRDCPSPLSGILVEQLRGQVTRVDASATAFPHREPGFSVLVVGQWKDPAQTNMARSWVRDTFDAIQPFATRRSYANYLAGDDDQARDVFGQNQERLARVKRRYDPHNLFHHNLNIAPTSDSRG